LGKGVVRRKGTDVTVVATSFLVHEAIKAAERLERHGIKVEVLDLRSLKPLDENLLFTSIKKTKKAVLVDGGWKTCGLTAEISARIAESKVFTSLRAPIARVSLPDTPAPASSALEKVYYPNVERIMAAVKDVLEE
jgi:pyruvate dehydrogenase E1 component beta subunit